MPNIVGTLICPKKARLRHRGGGGVGRPSEKKKSGCSERPGKKRRRGPESADGRHRDGDWDASCSLAENSESEYALPAAACSVANRTTPFLRSPSANVFSQPEHPSIAYLGHEHERVEHDGCDLPARRYRRSLGVRGRRCARLRGQVGGGTGTGVEDDCHAESCAILLFRLLDTVWCAFTETLTSTGWRALHPIARTNILSREDHGGDGIADILCWSGQFPASCDAPSQFRDILDAGGSVHRPRACSGDDHITVCCMDFRECRLMPEWVGSFDKFISIEMIEHVGKDFFTEYWAVEDWALRPDSGVGVLQGISITEARVPSYDTGTDFMQKWVLCLGFVIADGLLKNMSPPSE
ncbi:hypothetical protein FB451DRAFT_1178764 [Mycena latifolia]|nr:hypothetical protein FB451DRAFT_1178764 [Mycena latifolia]